MRRDERGQALIFFAVLLPVALLILGLTLDFGRAQLARAQVRTAADAAALAGASTAKLVTVQDNWGNVYSKEVRIDEATARSAALDCLARNAAGLQGVTVLSTDVAVSEDPVEVTVTVRARVDTFFLPLAGIKRLDFTVTATAGAQES